MTPSLEGWPTKAKEGPSPHEVRLAPLGTNPVFQSLGGKQKDEWLSRPWSHPVVFNTGPLDWESSPLTTRPLRSGTTLKHKLYKFGNMLDFFAVQ